MATRVGKRRSEDSGVGSGAVGGGWVLLFAVLFIVMSLVLLYATITYWPATIAEGATATDSKITFLGVEFTLSRDKHLLLMVALLGGVGAMAHVMRSFFKYVGERHLVWSWMASYFLIPFVGAVIALITYIVLRAGLLGGFGDEEGNIWGFAAIAVLVGMFSAQAASKLKDVFETVLTSEQPGSEPIDPDDSDANEITFTPKSGPVGTRVEISGERIDGVATVTFGGGVAATAPTWDAGDKRLTATVPTGATTGPLKVTLGTTELVSSEDFEVTQ